MESGKRKGRTWGPTSPVLLPKKKNTHFGAPFVPFSVFFRPGQGQCHKGAEEKTEGKHKDSLWNFFFGHFGQEIFETTSDFKIPRLINMSLRNC